MHTEPSRTQTGRMTNPIPRQAADIAPIAALFADRARARIISALADGRALPASVLAQESGVAASTASSHLARLVEGGVLRVERSGRHRYYQIAGPEIAAAVEALSLIAPQPPVSSLRESTRAAAMRRARTCYDHLAGRVGVALLEGLLDAGALGRGDGRNGTIRGAADRLAAPVAAHPYELGPRADQVFGMLGVDLGALVDRPAAARPLLRFCVDWSEQRHHLAGALGAAVCSSAESAGWFVRRPGGRAVEVTDAGRQALRETLGVQDVA
jgi:DNA-binding transcriptional ArsR family regulator